MRSRCLTTTADGVSRSVWLSTKGSVLPTTRKAGCVSGQSHLLEMGTQGIDLRFAFTLPPPILQYDPRRRQRSGNTTAIGRFWACSQVRSPGCGHLEDDSSHSGFGHYAASSSGCLSPCTFLRQPRLRSMCHPTSRVPTEKTEQRTGRAAKHGKQEMRNVYKYTRIDPFFPRYTFLPSTLQIHRNGGPISTFRPPFIL